jgi:DNA-binding transcriptional MerR regulator
MTVSGAVEQREPELLTIDELAGTTGMTVRTTRYYASLGLLPPPVRRGRMAYYGPEHLARLDLIRALQEHGFTLSAIERYLAGVPMTASAEELAVQRALLTAWKPGQWDPVTRKELETRAGRQLGDDDIDWLLQAGAVRRKGDAGGLEALPLVDLAMEALSLDLPIGAIVDANTAVRRHMSELADELTGILQARVMSRYERDDLSMEDAERLERTLTNLRALTLDAIVTAFQRAANHVVRTSLSLDEDHRDEH